jgi:large subunit ribosomal protein L23
MNTVLKYPMITEKSSRLQADGQYVFAVETGANKLEIKQAVEKLKKGINVVSVRTQVMRGKVKRVGAKQGKRANWKKAIVKLKAGQSLDLFETTT